MTGHAIHTRVPESRRRDFVVGRPWNARGGRPARQSAPLVGAEESARQLMDVSRTPWRRNACK
jgi:hypothetical protein